MKRKTKGQLVREYYERRGKVSPEIGTEVREGADDVKLNIPYEIVNVEDIKTEVRTFTGIRVELLSVAAKVGSVVLWKRPITGKGSKLGVFITLLGSNTDKWLHKWIVFKGWEQNSRLVELVAPPVEKSAKVRMSKAMTKVAEGETKGDK